MVQVNLSTHQPFRMRRFCRHDTVGAENLLNVFVKSPHT
jgi:hypothetical protein